MKIKTTRLPRNRKITYIYHHKLFNLAKFWTERKVIKQSDAIRIPGNETRSDFKDYG